MNEIIKKFAIVILNYNSINETINCYNSIKKLNKFINVIIVDNNSSDNSEELLKKIETKENTKIIFNRKNEGYAAGNNIGLKYIYSTLKEVEVAFIMNPDIIIDKLNVFFELYNTLTADRQLGAITSLTIYNGKLNFPNDCCWKMLENNSVYINGSLLGKIKKQDLKYYELDINNDNIAYVDVIQGCFFGIKMDVAKKIDFLDESTFLYCEEQLMARRLKKHKFKVGVLISTYIHHNHYEKDKELINKKNKIKHLKYLKESRKVIINKYLEKSKIFKFYASFFLDFDYYLKTILIKIGF